MGWVGRERPSVEEWEAMQRKEEAWELVSLSDEVVSIIREEIGDETIMTIRLVPGPDANRIVSG